MINKLLAMLFVVLCILPNAAPFSAVPTFTVQQLDRHAALTVESGASAHIDVDNNDAIAVERVSFQSESHNCATEVDPGALCVRPVSRRFVNVQHSAPPALSDPPAVVVLRV